METLNDLLGIDLKKAKIFDINEEHLILLKTEDFYTQNNFYFYLYNKLISLDSSKSKEFAYCNYLISYYLFIVMTPLNYEEISFFHAKKAFDIDNSVKYMEWLLLFGTLEKPLLTYEICSNLARNIKKHNPNSTLAQFFE
ncbi:hypothetical protein [Clostridium sp. B9]|uniref:hypothetical protein n=1 Tax=Clostridium sp. B9 TaxID=3423224 RepID=UPI003D2EDBA6